jgi:hypothetical protein
MDQENFTNVSWHSESVGGTAGPSGNDVASPGRSNGTEAAVSPVPNLNQLDAGGLGSETLECTVSEPLNENEGTNSQFVSYLVATNVSSVPCLYLDVSFLSQLPRLLLSGYG